MSPRKPGILFSVFSLLLLLVPGVSAQTEISGITPGTITVTGEGSASAPAEQASILITLGPNTYTYYEPIDTMSAEVATTSTSEPINTAAVIDAIVAYGVPVNDVVAFDTPFQGEWGEPTYPQPASIMVTIMNPTVEGLSELLDVVRAAAAAEGLFVNQFGVMYIVSDCRPIRQVARANAVANARMEAEDQAAALNTTIGNPISSRDTYPINMGYAPTNSCNTMPTAKPYAMIYAYSQFDPGQPAEVSVTIAVEVSFEIP